MRSKSSARSGLVAVLLLCAAGLGCVSSAGHPGLPSLQAEYRIAPPDILVITVRPDPQIERELTVRPDGRISLDLIGDVDARGKTVEEKGQLIWQYHIKPRDLARIAAAAKVKLLVLYHVQNYSDPCDPDAVLKEVREYYRGTPVQARDGNISWRTSGSMTNLPGTQTFGLPATWRRCANSSALTRPAPA